MMWGMLKAVQCFSEKPEFVFGIGRVTNEQADNCEFVIGDACLAEGIFEVTLLENMAMTD